VLGLLSPVRSSVRTYSINM